MTKLNVIKILFIVLIVSLLGISTVQAVKPNNQACLGQSVSNIVHIYGGNQFGAGVSTVAMNPDIAKIIDPKLEFRNLGKGVQVLLNGDIPDYIIVVNGNPYVIENTCHD